MKRILFPLLFPLAGAVLLPAADQVVFRSDVSLVRVDAQVIGRDNRAVTGLRAADFVLRDEGRPQQIRNFLREDMPVDVLLLLDVSTSMRPHIQRISSAARQALQEMGNDDRVAIMVFDRATRVRMPFRNSRDEVERELAQLLRQERFNGGTDITRGMLDAADYVARSARPQARRAIVIVTDDQTERERDEDRVSNALVRADTVLSALIAPDAMRYGSQSPGMGRGGGGGGWPGGGRSRGGIILGPRGGYGGRGPGPGVGGPRTHSAGTSEIARDSGGDSMGVEDASALETTLARIRQRYALHFLSPEDARPGQRRALQVELADAARSRYPDAEVRFRRYYLTSGGSTTDATSAAAAPTVVVAPDQPPALKRRPAVSDSEGPRGPNPALSGTPRPAPAATPQPDATSQPAATPAPKPGWRRVKPGEEP